MQIDVDFDVYKSLTSKRLAEDHSYNDVLRELLGLPQLRQVVAQPVGIAVENSTALALAVAPASGLHTRGLFLPNGTKLRALYKGSQYEAAVGNGVIAMASGKAFTSPSAAASAITQTTVNGWRFWEAMRPNDLSWQRLESLK